MYNGGSADAALLIGAQAALLEAPDAHHRAVKHERSALVSRALTGA